MRAVEQWRAIEAGLGGSWDEVKLSFAVEDPGAADAAAAMLAPLSPGRSGGELLIRVQREGAGPEKLRNLLERLDRKRIWGSLALVGAADEPSVPRLAPSTTRAAGTLVESWEAEVAKLPPGWRDLLCELQLDSTDYLARGALLGAALNPTRNPEAIALRFRVSSGTGYGTAPQMVRRSLERMDSERITGLVRVLTVLSDTENAATQGPVWRVAGRSV